MGSIPESTLAYREFLLAFCDSTRFGGVVDPGCGDWNFSRLIA